MPSPRSASAVASRRRFDSVEQAAYLNLWRTYDLLKAYEDRLFGEHDLSAQQYNTLRLLKAVHPLRVPTRELGHRLVSRAPDMTRLLDRLERMELITRQRSDHDRRVVNVFVTPAGRRLLKRLDGPVRELEVQVLRHLSAVELQQLIRLLEQARSSSPSRKVDS